MTASIGIEGLDKAKLLAAFYNASKGPRDEDMTLAEANSHVQAVSELRFNFIGSCSLKIDLNGNTLDPTEHDISHSAGHAAGIVQAFRLKL